ncbi:hypothetical protein BDW62DRAFT_216632 [Aspergillus aurantiobrunneus]
MPKIVESHARRQMREALTHITRNVRDFGVDEFNLRQLKGLNIRIDPLVLDETSPHKSVYLASYPGDLLPETDAEALGGTYNGIDDDQPDSFFHCYSCPNDRSHVVNNHPQAYIQWMPSHECFTVTDMDGPSYTHVKAIMQNNMVAKDSTILCGELLPALRIMLTQLKKQRFSHHMVSPYVQVMVISLVEMKARVIELYFSKGTLVVRPTKLYDFTHRNNAAFKTLAQWYLGKQYCC